MERYFKFSELSKLEQQMYYNYIYLFLMEANMQYPAFSVWYGNLFTDDLKLKPEREIIVCEKEYEIAGVTILKHFGFVLQEENCGLYNPGKIELIYNGKN